MVRECAPPRPDASAAGDGGRRVRNRVDETLRILRNAERLRGGFLLELRLRIPVGARPDKGLRSWSRWRRGGPDVYESPRTRGDGAGESPARDVRLHCRRSPGRSPPFTETPSTREASTPIPRSG